jgi:hypothetical protein
VLSRSSKTFNEKDEQWVNDVSSRLNPKKLGFLI